MSANIIIKKEYILVAPQANDFYEIIETLGRLFKMPEYLQLNTVWKFPAGRLAVTYEQLYKIRDVLQIHFPKSSRQTNKTAIVAQTGLQIGMANSYAEIVKDLPFEVGVFPDVRSAEAFIISG